MAQFALSQPIAGGTIIEDDAPTALADARPLSDSCSVYGLFARTVQQEHGSGVTAADLEEAMSIHGMGPVLAKKLFRHYTMVAESPHYDPAESFDLHPSEAGTTKFGANIKERDYAEPAPNTAVTMAMWPKAKAQHGQPTGRETSLASKIVKHANADNMATSTFGRTTGLPRFSWELPRHFIPSNRTQSCFTFFVETTGGKLSEQAGVQILEQRFWW
jgi:hypothetical protein